MNGFEILLPIGIILVFPLFFVGLWCSVLRLLSWMSGWRRLAERFHHPKPFEGSYYRFQTAHMTGVRFGGVLEIGVGETGLYLVPMILFRLFHPPLLIPWSELRAASVKRFLFEGHRLTFHSFPGIELDLHRRTFEKMARYLER